MILAVECLSGCLIFGVTIILSLLKNKEFWLYEYPKPIQQRYIELHPDCEFSEPEGFSLKVLIKKIAACLIFIVLLSGMVYLAGARNFFQGGLFSYTIWFVVNLFDTMVLDLGFMVHWKKCRLEGTENMDAEYKLLNKKSLIDGVYGCLIGIPVSLIVGSMIALMF
ncbi:MAG: hypothetical protein Q4D29_11830 [Lachnospiraceae bacterium]|nr:hypothetical protein [Lachnospiraceae bacterium]